MNEWINQYKQYHTEHNEYGNGGGLKFYLQHIVDLVNDTKSKSLLDFGCGKAEGYLDYKHHKHWGIMPSLYDPAIPEYENFPKGSFDGVMSFDVLEHIPEIQIPETIYQITKVANKFVFLGIATDPAIAVLPNGDNAHCTLKPMDWWVEMINKHSYKQVYTHIKLHGEMQDYAILNESLYMDFFLENLELKKVNKNNDL